MDQVRAADNEDGSPVTAWQRRLVAHMELSASGMRFRVSDMYRESVMLWTIVVILIALWALGFLALNIGGGLIHLLLVVAAVVLVYQLVTGRRVV